MIALFFLLLAAPPDAGLPMAGDVMDVRADGPNRYVVAEKLIDPRTLSTSCRVVPAFKDGQAIGFKLVGIRAGSIVARMGLKNGDVVRSVGGHTVATPETAMEAYTWLLKARTVVVAVKRQGEMVELTYTFEGSDRTDVPFTPSPTTPDLPEFELQGHLRGALDMDFGVGALAEGRLELHLVEAVLAPGPLDTLKWPTLRLGEVVVEARFDAPTQGEAPEAQGITINRLSAQSGEVRVDLVEPGHIVARGGHWASAHLSLRVVVSPRPDLLIADTMKQVFGEPQVTLRCEGRLQQPRCRVEPKSP